MKTNKKIATALACALFAGGAVAEDVNLPDTVAWTAYDLGSTGYNQAVAIGSALKDAYGVNLRVLPGKNDIARTEPLRQRKVDFSNTGIGATYLSQEAVMEFAAKKWGPQPVRLLLMNNAGDTGLSVGVAREACEKIGKPGCEGFTYADLKGMNVAFVLGSPALNLPIEAILAYADLTWDDVNVVRTGGYGDTYKGMAAGSIDALFSSTASGLAYEQATNPRGIFWPEMDPNNVEGIARMKEVLPYFGLITATVGAELDGTEGVTTTSYPYPMLIAMADQDEAFVYSMTKAMVEQFDNYDGKVPGVHGWALDRQDFEWLVPYHDGAIRYFKEIGAWGDAAQANNDALVARQRILADAWAALEQENPGDWEAAWDERRREALGAAGLTAPF